MTRIWNIAWNQAGNLASKAFICGHCGAPLSSEKGYSGAEQKSHGGVGLIYICHFCKNPTYFDPAGTQSPGAIYGGKVEGIDEADVEQLYDEARKAIGVGSYTSSVLTCRKLLMHIAVSKGAEEGKSFLSYVEYLSDKNYIPEGSKGWVDHIREKGNEANHEIVIMEREDAEELVSFSEMLLKVIYEYPSKVKKPEEE